MANKPKAKEQAPKTRHTVPYEEGREEYLRNNRNNLLVRASLMESEGNYAGAIQEVEKALKRHPGNRFVTSYYEGLLRRFDKSQVKTPSREPPEQEIPAPTTI